MTARLRPLVSWVALAALALSGCATLSSLDSEVHSYSQWPAEKRVASFAFERLPSQQVDGERQRQLEEAARPAFRHAGFKEVPGSASPDVTVQVGNRTTRDSRGDYWDDPFLWGPGPGYPYWGRGWGWGWAPSMAYRSPRYDHEVLVLIRDAGNGRPLYETRASYESYGGVDLDVLTALFDAAMKDFPQPAISPREVRVPLPSAAAAPVPPAADGQR